MNNFFYTNIKMEFRASILPLYYVCKVMGLAPFSYSNKISVHTKKNKSTKGLLSPNVLWSFFVFLIHLTGFMSLMFWSIMYDYRNYNLSVTIPDALTILTMYSTCFASLVGAVFNRRRMEILMMNFTAIDQILLPGKSFKCHYGYSIHKYYANPQAQVSKSQ
jgi:hypothetical protein